MSYEINKGTGKYDIGDGKMEYIKDASIRELLTTAWKAITLTNNWDFVYQDTSSLILKNDNRKNEILQKITELNPRYVNIYKYSYRIIMRYMQYLIQNGEEKFEKFVNKLFIKT